MPLLLSIKKRSTISKKFRDKVRYHGGGSVVAFQMIKMTRNVFSLI